MKIINVGLIGLGTVGSGVARALLEKASFLEKKAGVRLVLKKVCARHLDRARALKLGRLIITTDPLEIIQDPEIDVVIELMGGIHPAKEIILKALQNGKHVVTANKALLAEEGRDLFAAADANRVELYFEASVGGGIPIIKAVREGLVANEIDTLLGIVNGTSNFILTAMAREGLEFHDALNLAQAKGFAERNPALDVEGMDSAHKLAILALLGFGASVRVQDIYVEGILHISQSDIRYAQDFGYVIKLLAIAKRDGQEIEVRVHPTLLSKEHLLANVNGVYNAIYIHGDLVGGTLFYGRGAGQRPTTSAVISDCVDLALNLKQGLTRRLPSHAIDTRIKRIRPIDEIETRYYLRFSAIDRPGVLARISGILGKHNISISSVSQKERKKARIVPVVVMTHEAKESNVRQAVEKVDRLPVIRRKTVVIRTESPKSK